MVEVFKTNIQSQKQALNLLERLYREFDGYTANFDLEDRDRILRLECQNGSIAVKAVLLFLRELDYQVTVLPDEIITETISSPR